MGSRNKREGEKEEKARATEVANKARHTTSFDRQSARPCQRPGVGGMGVGEVGLQTGKGKIAAIWCCSSRCGSHQG